MPERTPAPKPGRPRDPDAPPKPRRPRDELGRPLPWQSENQLELEDYDSLTLDRNHELGMEHWNAGRFFPAHEAWETCWKQAKETPESEFFKGLSQLGAGYVHLFRGNQHGAYTLLRRGANRILQYPDGHRAVDVMKVAAAVLSHALYIESAERRGRPSVDLTPPKI